MYAQQLQSEPYVYAVIKQQGQSINLLDLDRLIAESAVSRMDRPDFSG
jgi:chemotaxis signal transduction protein